MQVQKVVKKAEQERFQGANEAKITMKRLKYEQKCVFAQ